ncbi:hypothetical protein J6590_060743 [Homalodisca vitripennis]|nr:hypothetical protein J6590_060743 [Homalodisca vitripennis]
MNMAETSGNNSEDSENELSSSEDSAEEYDTDSGEEGMFDPTWSPTTSGHRNIPFTGENKLLWPKPTQNRPVDWLWVLFDIILIENIIQFTNFNARELFFGPNLEPQLGWKDLTVNEFKTFIGILLHMGTVRLNRIKDYWKTNYFLISRFSGTQ